MKFTKIQSVLICMLMEANGLTIKSTPEEIANHPNYEKIIQIMDDIKNLKEKKHE